MFTLVTAKLFRFTHYPHKVPFNFLMFMWIGCTYVYICEKKREWEREYICVCVCVGEKDFKEQTRTNLFIGAAFESSTPTGKRGCIKTILDPAFVAVFGMLRGNDCSKILACKGTFLYWLWWSNTCYPGLKEKLYVVGNIWWSNRDYSDCDVTERGTKGERKLERKWVVTFL